MKKTHYLRTSVLAASCALSFGTSASAVNLAINGDFETGDTSGWSYFPTASSSLAVTGDANGGSFAAELFNDSAPSAALIKQEQVGAGVVTAGQTITISFWAKGTAAVGGVHFAEFFSHNSGGGVTKSEILGGAPLFPSSTTYEFYEFTTTAAGDVAGGVTLQLTATTGAAVGSEARLFVDDVKIEVVPEPSASILLGSTFGLLMLRRRRS